MWHGTEREGGGGSSVFKSSDESNYTMTSNFSTNDNNFRGFTANDVVVMDDEELRQLRGGRNQLQQHQQDSQGQQQQLNSRSNDAKHKIGGSQLFLNSEDMRISKLLRRLLNENNCEVALELCEKLEIVVRSPKNTSYICNSAEQIFDSMLQVLKQCPEQCLPHASNIIGLVGFINRTNFPIYKNFIKNSYQQHRILRKWIMLALQSTFTCDVHSSLEVYSERLLELLIEFLENADETEIFMAVSNTIVEFSKIYEKPFKNNFNDIVDIIVGWHLETDQSQKLKLHCATVLQKFSPYFIKETEFTLSLLGQFLEDIEAYGDEKDSEGSASKTGKRTSKVIDERVGSLMSAFNSIWKSLATPTEFYGLQCGSHVVKKALNVMITAAESVLENYKFSIGYEETVLGINEFLSILNQYNYEGLELDVLERLVQLEFKKIRFFDAQQIASLLFLILTYVEYKRTALPMSFVTLVFNTQQNPLNDIKVMKDGKLYALLIKIYQEVLMLKSVPILQEVYRHIKHDLEFFMNVLANETETATFKTNAAMINMSFYLTTLSALATQTSSIIGMYALEPSILELLIINCKAGDYKAWQRQPVLYNALLQLLVVHCKKNHNFIMTSSLLQAKRSTSPTSEHLLMIFRFLRSFFSTKQNNIRLEVCNLKLILQWFHTLLLDLKNHSDGILKNSDFLGVCRQLSSYASTLPEECANCFIVLLQSYKNLPKEIVLAYKSAAVYLMQSSDKNVREIYTVLLAYIPFDLLASSSQSTSSEGDLQLNQLKHWYQSTANFVPLNSRFFKECVNRLGSHKADIKEIVSRHQPVNLSVSGSGGSTTTASHGADDCQFRQNAFMKSWLNFEGQHENAKVFVEQCNNNRELVNFWLHNEMARYCVRNKLRTTIGKPQETFLAIEAIIMNYARLLSIPSNKGAPKAAGEVASGSSNADCFSMTEAMKIQENVSSLLSFLDCLEKHIYNAGQGTAFALPNAEKPAKAFFRINSQTCHEWFKRIRPAVNLIAVHTMTPEMVIRNSEYILKAEFQQSNATLLEHTLISLCWALLSRNESDSLTGLYAWLKPKLGKRYIWIQFAAEQAAGRFEQAANGYLTLLNESECGTIRFEGAVKRFIVEQSLDCLYNTGQWDKFKSVYSLNKDSDSKSMKVETLYRSRSTAHIDTMQALYTEINTSKNVNCFQYQMARDQGYGYQFNHAMMPPVSGALQQLMDWSVCNDIPVSVDTNSKRSVEFVDNYSCYSILNKLEDICIAHTLQLNKTTSLSSETIDHIRRGVQMVFRHDAGTIGAELKHTQAMEFIFLNNIAQKLKNLNDTQSSSLTLNARVNCAAVNVPDALLTKCLLWSLLFEQRLLAAGCGDMASKAYSSLYLDIAANARQHGNVKFGCDILERLFAINGFHQPLDDLVLNLQNSAFQINASNTELTRGFVELAKIYYSQASTVHSSINSGPQMKAINLLSALSSQIIEQNSLYAMKTPTSGSVSAASVAADALLIMADWLTGRAITTAGNSAALGASLANSPQLQALLQKLPEVPIQMNDAELQELIPMNERAIGKLLNASVYQRNDSGNAWFTYGNWCYRWGKKLVEAKQADSDATPRGYLSERDMLEIKAVLENNVDDETVAQLVKVLNNQQLSSRDGLDEELDAHDISATEQIECELRDIQALANRPAEQLNGIIRVWRQAHKSVYAYYDTAVRAYLKYLCIETAASVKCDNIQTETKNLEEISDEIEDCGFVTTTLRILRLVVKHAFALQDALEEALQTTPLRPWKVIIPQLFSRLNHHEPYVRKSVSELLCRLAHEQPHSIIFPAVVGAQKENKLQFVAEQESKSSSELCKEGNLTLSNCFNTLLATLSNQSPETVAHVQLLVKELRRIALLWEEHWLHAITQLYSKYSPLFSTLENEIKKSSDSEKAILKHVSLLKDVVSDLEKIALTTNKEPETDYERNFQKHYQPLIDKILIDFNTTIENIPKGGIKPSESLLKIKQLYHSFQQRLVMRGVTTHPHSTSTLRIQDLSPVLANMRDTAIAMPGVDTFQKQPIFIKRSDNTVNILPTKTKPKKLAFYGSDGHKYTFLFKGLEDLHLDERIMQFLSISNLMMSRSGEVKISDASAFKANFYSVIPLGPQSGLISWVDGVTPIFSIYKRWQQRDAVLKQQQTKDGQKDSPTATAAQASSLQVAVRPSELFYKKLTPLLNEQNIKLSDPRKQWPLTTLRRVLDELTLETPRDLLAKELWCHATNIVEWRKSVRNYSISMAVMSVIGYVIGLGDRHLDNVLINLVTGEILHIDYNVCFEKGKSLRVPEKVPFRMTQNFEEALGLTGVEGTFRLSCEYVLRTLRKERETLLTLLEAFVYDPLVDWTTNDDNGHHHGVGGNNNNNNKNTAIGSTTGQNNGTSMLTTSGNSSKTANKIDCDLALRVRIENMKASWSNYVQNISSCINELVDSLDDLINCFVSLQNSEKDRNNLNEQIAKIREVEVLGTAISSHSLNTITQRYSALKRDLKELESLKSDAVNALRDVQRLLQSYDDNILFGLPQFAQMQQRILKHHEQQYENEFGIVNELLQRINEEQLYKDCDFARQEMDLTIQRETTGVLEFLKALSQYSQIMQFYPRSHLHKNNQLYLYKEWYKNLSDGQVSAEDLSKLKKQVEECLLERNQICDAKQCDSLESRNSKAATIEYSQLMEKVWIELNFCLHEAIKRLNELTLLQEQQMPTALIVQQIQQFNGHLPFELGLSNDLPAALSHNNTALLYRSLELMNKIKEVYDQLAMQSDESGLYEKINLIKIFLALAQQAFPLPIDDKVQHELQRNHTAALQALCEMLYDLNKLHLVYNLDYNDRLLRFFMYDNHPELQKCLKEICNATNMKYIMPESLAARDEILKELQCFLNDFYGSFEACEDRLQLLQKVAELIVAKNGLSFVTAEIELTSFLQTHLLSINKCMLNEWKFKAVAGTFSEMQRLAESLKSSNMNHIYDMRLVSLHISNYIACWQSRYLNFLVKVLIEAYHRNLKSIFNACGGNNVDMMPPDAMNVAFRLCGNFVSNLQQEHLLCQQQELVRVATKRVEHYTNVASAHYWANAKCFKDSQLMFGHIAYKEKILNSVQSIKQPLTAWKHTIAKIQDDIVRYTDLVKKRFERFTADDADAQHLIARFNQHSKVQTSRYQFFYSLAEETLDHVEVLLNFETLMDDNLQNGMVPHIEAQKAFLNLIEQWQKAFANYAQSDAQMTAVEKSIVELLDPEDKLDQYWISNVSALLEEQTISVQRSLTELEQTRIRIQNNLDTQTKELQNLFDNPFRNEMRQLLRSLSKTDKSQQQSSKCEAKSQSPSILRDAQQSLKSFYKLFNDLKNSLLSNEDYTRVRLEELKGESKDLLTLVQKNQDEMLQLMQRYIDQHERCETQSSNTPVRGNSPAAARGGGTGSGNNSGACPKETEKDNNSNGVEKKGNLVAQKRNAYAVSVWKRIRMKLEGRDPDSSRRSTVTEQIDYIIAEATNRDNLAVLYEGWTPWV